MSTQILTFFIEKISRTIRVRFSSREKGTVKVLRRILFLSRAHECAHASVTGNLDTDGQCAIKKGRSGRNAGK
jgi:hypothetical protein